VHRDRPAACEDVGRYFHRVRSDQPSPLSEEERALLDAFLAYDFPGVRELREQAHHVAAKRGCDCGCGTIDLVPDGTAVPLSEAANPVPVDGVVYHTDGEEAGGLILFVRDGMLLSLEIYSHGEPLPLPRLEQVTWRV
jgi:hypothetical protein